MTHKFPYENKNILYDPKRKEILPIDKILESLPEINNSIVVDLGAGTGYFTKPLAKKAKKLYAIDIEQKFVDLLKIKYHKDKNIEILLSAEDKIPLQNNSIDVVFTSTVFHELEGVSTIKEIKRILKKHAIFVIIDWKKEKTPMGPPIEERKSIQEVLTSCNALGFSLLREFTISKYLYGLIFI
ncbi:MAG: class I SAM-dependent methyltransferase [Candidatus Aenigmarchaeota archaeon]|nr:class I SAM-dependent methyltransferase [Candidatus Aenigmarchaeota archaeon]